MGPCLFPAVLCRTPHMLFFRGETLVPLIPGLAHTLIISSAYQSTWLMAKSIHLQ